MGLNKFLQSNLNSYCVEYELEEISHIFVAIRNADVMCKTRVISHQNILIPLTIDICKGFHA